MGDDGKLIYTDTNMKAPMRQELITEIKGMEQQAMAANAHAPADEEIVPESMEVHGGAGYGELQRAINETGEIPA